MTIPEGVVPVIVAVLASAAAGVAVGNAATVEAVVVVVAVAFVLLAIASPVHVALGVVALTPWFVYPTTAGRFSLFLAVPVVGLVATLLILAQQHPMPARWRDTPARTYAALVAIAGVMALLSTDKATGGSRVIYLILFGALAWALATAVISGRMRRRSLVVAVVVGGVLAGVALTVQVVYGLAVGRASVTDWLNSVYPALGGQRAAAVVTRNWYVEDVGIVRGIFPFMAAPSAGQYMMLSLVAAVWLRRDRASAGGGAARLANVAVVVITIGLLATFSRQAWVGALVGIAALNARRISLRPVLSAAAAIAVVAFLPVPGSSTTFGEYLLTAGDATSTSSGTRIALWRQAIDLIPAHVLRGVGPGLYSTLNPDPNKPIYYAHNTFLDVTVELGVVGGLLFAGGLALMLRSAWTRGATLGFSMIVAFAVAGLFDDVLYFPRNGLLVAVAFAFAISGDAPAEVGVDVRVGVQESGRQGAPSQGVLLT